LSANRLLLPVLVAALLIGSIAVYSYSSHLSSTPSTTSGSASSPGVCSQPAGVSKVQLSPSPQFGAVTTFALPKPLKAPNSIAVAPDGSIWFGEIALRGVAHLFTNGTLLQYAWPSSFFSPPMNCFDLSELWGLVIWHGMVWASDSVNGQLVALTPSNDTFRTVHLSDGSLPRFLAVDAAGDLWFTESSTPTQVGVLASPNSAPRYFDVPAGAGQISASLLFYNASLAYVVTVNPSDTAGEVFSFDPLLSQPVFTDVGANETLLAPYSVAAADGGLWVGEHDASDLAFYNQTSSRWSFYPTSLNAEVPATLPYYVLANGSSVWFNEHDSNRIGEISGAASLTEFNISSVPLATGGVGNALTIALGRNLVWFTEWTGNAVGYVNASVPPTFSISSASNSSAISVTPGSSVTLPLTISGTSALPLSLGYADSETHLSDPVNLSISSNVGTITGLAGTKLVALTVAAKPGTPAGEYLVLVTVTDGITYRSVYIPVDVP
jgi:streptogramin lyase